MAGAQVVLTPAAVTDRLLCKLHICTPVPLTLQVKRRQRGATRPQSAGQGQPRRRYQRVVRNENAPPPDEPDDNPFVVRKFTQVRSL